jgi:hypothetical protein
MAHDSKSQALNAVINVRSSHLRSSPEVLWWGFVGVQISVLSNLILFKIALVSKENLYIKGKCSGYTKQCNWWKTSKLATTPLPYCGDVNFHRSSEVLLSRCSLSKGIFISPTIIIMQVSSSLKELESREITYCPRDYPTPPLLQRLAFPYKGKFSKSHCPNPARGIRQPLPLELFKKTGHRG